jgi:transcription initiation factor TFIID TATA-box-binding protein
MAKRKYTPLDKVSRHSEHNSKQPHAEPCSSTDDPIDAINPVESSNSTRPSETCPEPTVHNIVSTAQIQSISPIDLTALSLILPYSFYDRQRFAAITIRLRSPDCTTLLFGSGKLVVTGGRNWHECVLAALCVCRILRDVFPSRQFTLSNCEIQNIVAHVELPVGGAGILDLQGMYGKLELNCMYQRTMFPGLIYRPDASPVVLLCFYSGKIVITGGKTVRDVHEGWKKLWPTVKVFVRDQV